MKIKKIKLITPILNELKVFYADLLGFSLVAEESHLFSIQSLDSQLIFEENLSISQPNYHFAFNIPYNQLQGAREWLLAKGIELLSFQGSDIIDFPNWNAEAIYFLDPGQNIVEFIARRDLDNAREGSFDLSMVEEISEIGLPVPEIAPFYQKLEAHFGIPVYSHISNMQTFCAAGDPKGLLILVPLERAWMPTKIINGTYPLEIVVEGKSSSTLQVPGLPYLIKSEL